MDQYSIVVPIFNSEKSIDELYDRINCVFSQYEDKDFELVLVDDSSSDHSFERMSVLHEKDKRVKAIQLSKNCGQHAALLCGFQNSKGDYVITMDDDLQHPPEEIPKLIQYMDTYAEVDVVIGRYQTKKHGFVRNIGSTMSNVVSHCVFHHRKDLQLTSFRLMRKFVADHVCRLNIDVPRVGNMLLMVSDRIENVAVEHRDRKYGKSGYRFSRLVKDFINNIITNSAFPLIVVRDIGIGSFIISILLAIYYLVRYLLYGVRVKGWTTLVLLVLLFSGLILLAIGIIGDYLIRILEESKKVPNYFVRQKMIEGEQDERS